MASASTPNHENNDEDSAIASKSYFQKTVCLNNWWLVKAEGDFEGKRLAVAGTNSRVKQALREFSSAPILRRYDVFTLDTVDGICVILEGFMNKDRTVANGFPPDVCDHFVFGFPPYWEMFARNCSKGEYPSTGVVQSNPDFGNLSPQVRLPGTRDSSEATFHNYEVCGEEERQENSCKKDFGAKASREGQRKEINNGLKSRSIFNSTVSTSAFGALFREPCSANSSAQNITTLEPSADLIDNSMRQPLAASRLGDDFALPSNKDNVNDAQNENYFGRKCMSKNLKDDSKSSLLSACCLNERRQHNSRFQAFEQPTKMALSKKSLIEMDFSREADLGEEVSFDADGRGLVCSLSSEKIKSKDNQLSGSMLEDEKIMGCSDEVGNAREHLDNESGEKSTLNLPGSGYQKLADEMTPTKPYARSVEDIVEQDCVSTTGKDTKQDQNNEGVRKARKHDKMDKTVHLTADPGGTRKRKEKMASGVKESTSRSANMTAKMSRRKLTYEIPLDQKEKEDSSVVSPESLSLKRSRSGRLLLPRLEFWRNERAIYDADHQFMGIKDLHLNQHSGGSRSEPQRKKGDCR